MDEKDCTGSARFRDTNIKGHSKAERESIGFSPCGEYVAHAKDNPCDVMGMVIEAVPHLCQCRTDSCPCGMMISHKISEPCTAKE